jgi:dTDP-4-amino-4,6-dideoxygalactose transaminase
MSRQPMYFDPRWTGLNAARFAATGLYLPTHTAVSEQDQDHIAGKVAEFYGVS